MIISSPATSSLLNSSFDSEYPRKDDDTLSSSDSKLWASTALFAALIALWVTFLRRMGSDGRLNAWFRV
jgi:hypothetical protein